jgi:hypothetical protein
MIKNKYEVIRSLSERLTSKRMAERPRCDEILKDKISWLLPNDITIKEQYDIIVQSKNFENDRFICKFMKVKLNNLIYN